MVSKQSASEPDSGGPLLPFEGDTVLTIIVSKAVPAEDTSVTDPTITRQIAIQF